MRWMGLLLVLLTLVTAPASGQKAPDLGAGTETSPIARFLGGTVLCEELLTFEHHHARHSSPPEPGPELAATLVSERLLARGARNSGLADEPEVAARLRRLRQQVLTEALDAELSAGIDISQHEIRELYQREPERVQSPKKLVSRFLLRRLPPDASAELVEAGRQEIETLRRRILAGEAFADLARQHSDAENASRGGLVAARPRASLLSEYEAVAWELEPGQLSPPVRIADGWALILVENFLPARRFSLEEATPRLRAVLESRELEMRRQHALREARKRWPHRLAPTPGKDATRRESTEDPVYLLADRRLDLSALGLSHRPPRLTRRIDSALDQQRLELLAESRFAGVAKIEETLARLEQTLLAKTAFERQLQAALPELAAAFPEAELEVLYQRRKKSLGSEEKRGFEGWFFPGTEGRLRQVHGLAAEMAEAWKQAVEAGKSLTPPTEAEPIRWGPFPRSTLGNSISPRFAAAAFALSPGEISPPLRMEIYDSRQLKFRSEGYVVLRLTLVEPATIPPFEEVRPQLLRIAARRQIPELEAKIRRRLLNDAAFEVLPEPLTRCLEIPR